MHLSPVSLRLVSRPLCHYSCRFQLSHFPRFYFLKWTLCVFIALPSFCFLSLRLCCLLPFIGSKLDYICFSFTDFNFGSQTSHHSSALCFIPACLWSLLLAPFASDQSPLTSVISKTLLLRTAALWIFSPFQRKTYGKNPSRYAVSELFRLSGANIQSRIGHLSAWF